MAVIIYLSVPLIFLLILVLTCSYLCFHFFAETLTVAIALSFFVYGFRRRGEGAFFSIVGVGFLSVGILDAFHLLAYKGMGIFPVVEENVATQFWIAARFAQAVTLLFAVLLSGRKIRTGGAAAISAAYAAGVTAAIFSGYFPDAFVAPGGLTYFKIYSEYIIIGILIFVTINSYRLKSVFDYKEQEFLSVAFALAILSEFSFTLYNDVYGIMNFVGHILKTASYILICFIFIPVLCNKLVDKQK